MYISTYANYDPTKSSTYNFYGINRTRRTSKGEFCAMKNMSTIEYPCAAPCGKKKFVAKANGPIQAVVAPDSTNVDEITGFTGIAGGEFYYNGIKKAFKFYDSPLFPDSYQWEIIRKGNLYIFNGYDSVKHTGKMYYYNVDTDTFAHGGNVMSNLIVSIEKVNADEDDYTYNLWIGPYGSTDVLRHVGVNADGSTVTNSHFYKLYCDEVDGFGYGYGTDEEPDNVFKEYFSPEDKISISGFPEENDAYNGRIFSEDEGEDFKIVTGNNSNLWQNNTVNIDTYGSTSGISKHLPVYLKVIGFSQRVSGGSGTGMRKSYGLKVVAYNKNDLPVDLYYVKGYVGKCNWVNGITISTYRPLFDHIGVHNGRLWGTLPTGDQIYASASDQIFSWSADDIYKGFAARIASDAPSVFTGLCAYSGDMIAFKESTITVINGDNPVNYYSYDLSGIGCIDPKSIVVTPSGVIFLSYNGFYIFTGHVPQLLSAKLNTQYVSATACYDGNVYYASAVTSEGVRENLAYDLRYNTWHITDNMDVRGLYNWHGKRYICDNLILYEWQNEADKDVEWSFTSAISHDNTLDMKAVNELWIRCELGEGAELTVETCTDDKKFKKHATYKTEGLNIFHCPVRAEMDSYYQYRISGRGMVVFYEIEIQKSFGGRQFKGYAETEKTDRELIEPEKDLIY